MKLKKCKTNVRPHEINGIEIELIGDCGDLVDKIMENLGPYGQRYIRRRMVFSKEEADSTSNRDIPSRARTDDKAVLRIP